MLMDHYSKAPTAITNSEGTAFAQNGGTMKKGKGDKDKAKSDTPKDPKNLLCGARTVSTSHTCFLNGKANLAELLSPLRCRWDG